MIDVSKLKLTALTRHASPGVVLGLTLDGNRLEGLELRRSEGAFQLQNPLSIALSLDPLTNEPDLVGREMRNHLDAAHVRDHQCVLGLPSQWALTVMVEVPQMPAAEVPGFLQIEAERNFPCDVQTLQVSHSICHSAAGKQYALLVGVPKAHIGRLEQVLQAARLKPMSFSLGITALQPPSEQGVLALAIGERQVALQISVGGGLVALRSLDGMLEAEGGERVFHADAVAREARITLGQLPAELREAVRLVRVFGPRDLVQQLVDELDLRFEAAGLKTEAVLHYGSQELEGKLPPNSTVSAACSLAASQLAGRRAVLEFLPPHISSWETMARRYASGRYRSVLVGAGGVALLVGGLFFYQQCRLWRLQAQWSGLSGAVAELNGTQEKIHQYRPWYDERVEGLSLLRAITLAFPEEGTVTVKTVEIRDLNTITCTGTAKSYQALLQTLQKLRAIPQMGDVNLGPTRGQVPALQFSFNLVWNEGGKSAN